MAAFMAMHAGGTHGREHGSKETPIVDGLPEDGHVVGVQHAVHEADALPCRHQSRRALHHLRQEQRVFLVWSLTCAKESGLR